MPANPIQRQLALEVGQVKVTYTRRGTVRSLLSPQKAFPTRMDVAMSLTEKAKAFLDDHPNLLALSASDDKLTHVSTRSLKSGGALASFRQSKGNVICDDAAVTVALDSKRGVIGFISSTFPIGTPKTASITPAQLQAHLASGESIEGAATLAYIDRRYLDTPRLAWKLRTKDSASDRHNVWLDANTGKVLSRAPMKDGAGTYERSVYDADTVSTPKVRGENPFYCHCGPSPCSCLASKFQDVWDATSDVSDYYGSRGWNSYDGAGSAMRANLDTAVSSGNGQWNRTTKRVIMRPNHAPHKDITAHEWGHALADNLNFDISNSDTHALSEGFADCFGMMVYDDNWTMGEGSPGVLRDAFDPFWDGGYRNHAYGDAYQNSKIVSHICYLSVFLRDPVADPSPFPFSCYYDTSCPQYIWPLVNCVATKCISWSQAVPVPYLGREHGYGTIFKVITQQYPVLTKTSDFEHLHNNLTFAGCLYDIFDLATGACTVAGETASLATFAAGLYDSPAPVTDSAASFAYTDQRPAFVRNAKTGSSHAAALFREGRTGTNHGKIFMSYDNGLEMVPAFFEVKDSVNQVAKSGAGIAAVRSPYQVGNDAVIVFKNYSSNDIKYLSGAIGQSGISWNTQIQTLSGAQTDKTPVALNFSSQLYYIWKKAGSTTIEYKHHTGSVAGITGAPTDAAPTATVAAGRLWVFFKKAGTDEIWYTSKTASGDWATPTSAGEIWTKWDPEAIFYQPMGGLLGDGRIWLFYKRPYMATMPDKEEGTRMISWKPTSAGTLTAASPPVFLYQTRVPTGTGATTFYSAFHWEASLRVFFPKLESGDTIIWRMSKIGEG